MSNNHSFQFPVSGTVKPRLSGLSLEGKRLANAWQKHFVARNYLLAAQLNRDKTLADFKIAVRAVSQELESAKAESLSANRNALTNPALAKDKLRELKLKASQFAKVNTDGQRLVDEANRALQKAENALEKSISDIETATINIKNVDEITLINEELSKIARSVMSDDSTEVSPATGGGAGSI